jgi:hypothetical protein
MKLVPSVVLGEEKRPLQTIPMGQAACIHWHTSRLTHKPKQLSVLLLLLENYTVEVMVL